VGDWQVEVGAGITTFLDATPFGWIAEGLAVPERFSAKGQGDGLRVEIDVELLDGRLRARRVCIETNSDRGVTAAAVRSVPIRQIVIGAGVGLVHHVEISGKSVSHTLTDPNDEEVIEAVEAAVGYVEAKR
jgi:hypothetical protein